METPGRNATYQSEVDEGNDAVNLKSPLDTTLEVIETSSEVTATEVVDNK